MSSKDSGEGTADDPKSVSIWMERLKAGDEEAARHLWERYFQRLVVLARKKLGSAPRRTFDEEDVAVSAFKSICLGASEGRFPKFDDREDLWKLLVAIARQKSVDRIRRETAKKRGGGAVRGGSILWNSDASVLVGFEQFAGEEPTPEFLAVIAEQHENLLAGLGDESLRQIAQSKLDGYSTPEIAEQTGMSDRSVRRKLRVIREIWSSRLEAED